MKVVSSTGPESRRELELELARRPAREEDRGEEGKERLLGRMEWGALEGIVGAGEKKTCQPERSSHESLWAKAPRHSRGAGMVSQRCILSEEEDALD